jgi:acetyltransferase
MLHRTMTSLLTVSAVAGFRDSALFRPRSVVLVGDPALPETGLLARNLAAGGFQGRLFAVGLAPEGLEAAPSVAELPHPPDLAVVSLKPEALPGAIEALTARGCFAAIVTGAGPDLGALCARTGMRAYGQGSFGLCVPAIGLNASLSHIAPLPGKLALVTQSAATARTVLDWAAAEAVGFSHVIGVGGNASIGFAVALDWLARDTATGAVVLDLRRVRNRRAFLSAARATARTRPVVAMRAGGRCEDPSGLGDSVMEAALRRAGVLQVSGLEDLLAAAETLVRARLRPGGIGPGDRVAIVTNGIGLGQMAADAVLRCGGRLAQPSAEAMAALALLVPPGWPAMGNPLALGPMAGPRLAEGAAMLAALPEVDSVLALHAPTADGEGEVAAEALVAAAKASAGRRGAPILLGWTGQATAGAQRAALAEAGLAVFDSPEAAVRGALHLARDRQNRAAAAELPPREVLDLAPDRGVVRRLFARARAEGRRALTEEESLGVLDAYGLPTVPGRQAASSPEDAADAAALLGFPVVLKVLSPDLPHKSEVGGVQLGLASAVAVREAAAAMLARVRRARPDAAIAGFLVQRQAARALELRIRVGEDPMFGPWIGFGEGGTAADLAGDEAFDLPPLNLALAGQLIGRARVAARMAGYRDWKPVSRAAVADALVRVSQIVVDFPEIAALSVNPLFCDAEGVLAVDAGIALRPAGQSGLLAIAPYPAELIRPFRTRSGEALTVRPIRPEDAEAHAEAFRRIPPEDVRYRFFSPLKELSPALTARLTQIDYDREIAFVATRPEPDGRDRTVGVARLIRAPGQEDEAEFAIIVWPEMKGSGLARHLVELLLEWGHAHGVRQVVGQVLSDNAPMLGFVRALGFELRRSREDAEVMEARLALRPAPGA